MWWRRKNCPFWLAEVLEREGVEEPKKGVPFWLALLKKREKCDILPKVENLGGALDGSFMWK